jgi:hypothetical protein
MPATKPPAPPIDGADGRCAVCGGDHAPGAHEEAVTGEALRQIEDNQRARERDRAVRLVTAAFAPYKPPSQLRSGPGMKSEWVQAHQRRRIYFGLAEAIRCDGGWEGATGAKVVYYARVSRKAFYALFTDRDDCLRQAAQRAEGEGGLLWVNGTWRLAC